MTTWKGIHNWAVGEALTAGNMNNYINDNLDALKAPPTDDYVVDEGADYSTTSTSWVDVDSSDLQLTITTTGGDVLIGFYGFHVNASSSCYFDVTLDGTRIGGDDGLQRAYTGYTPVSFVYLKTGLSAGTHVFKLQWRVLGATSYLYAGAGTTNNDLHPQFWVREG